ncbi:MAG: BON domain-containing protein [Gemmatimonadota bacterium]|nr:BON domain-containing protein [Gemmatimonadota bacterium]
MLSTRRTASSIAAIALIVAAAACAPDDAAISDTAAGAVGATTAATTATPSAERVDDRVEVALSTDTTLRAFGLDADDDDGRVVLKGAVRTEAQKAAAAQLATSVASGLTIDNRIRVDANARMSTGNPIDVDDVEEQVEGALEADATLKPFNLDVDEDNGQIVLEGTVRTAEQKTMAEQIAKRIAGTVVVVNRVKVQ